MATDSGGATPDRIISGPTLSWLVALAAAGVLAIYALLWPPVIDTLSCDPCVLEAGKTATIAWETRRAKKVRYESDGQIQLSPIVNRPEPRSGRLLAKPAERVKFTLTAISRFDLTSSSKTITLIPIGVVFREVPDSQPPVLEWRVSEPSARISLSRTSPAPVVLVADNLPAQGRRQVARLSWHTLTVTMEGVKVEKYVSLLPEIR